MKVDVIERNGLEKLWELSAIAESIQAAVAYWTLPESILRPSFIKAISHSDGFLCCDIHSPTSIDSLCGINALGGNIFLNLYQLTGKTEVHDAKGIPDNLMHSKVYIFNHENAKATIWVGSHNGTFRAMGGINSECALTIEADKSSDLYHKVSDHIERIRRMSEKFRVEDSDYYRMLQGGGRSDQFIEVEDKSNVPLTIGSEISIFGSLMPDYEQLKKVGKRLYLSVIESSTEKELIYKVEINQSGLMRSSGNKANLSFNARRYAARLEYELPMLEPKQAVPKFIYDKAEYFVSLVILEKMPETTKALEASLEKPWLHISTEKYIGLISDSVRNHAEFGMPDKSPFGSFKIQSAVTKDLLKEEDDIKIPSLLPCVLDLGERRSIKNHRLIRSRIIIE